MFAALPTRPFPSLLESFVADVRPFDLAAGTKVTVFHLDPAWNVL